MLPAVPGSLGEKTGLTELSVGRKAVLRAWEPGSLGVIAVVRAAMLWAMRPGTPGHIDKRSARYL